MPTFKEITDRAILLVSDSGLDDTIPVECYRV